MKGKLNHFLAAILLLCMVACNQRLEQTVRAARFSILDSDTACGEPSHRTLEIELLASHPAERAIIRLNGEDMRWDAIAPVLRDIYSVRAEKFVYVRVEPGVSSSDQLELDRLLEGAGTQRLCALDYKAPHKYIDQSVSTSE